MKKLKETDPVKTLIEEAKSLFQKQFQGRQPQVIARAPGRVNLIGEHTDYSEGYCFPIAIELCTVCCLARSSSSTHNVLVSVHSPQPAIFEVGKNAEEDWAKYAAGVAAQYGVEFAFEASFATNVPLGGGLSSSAALEVSFAAALEQLIDPEKDWDSRERALRCVEGDHTYVGVPCGIMDQFASSCAKQGHAVLIDCRTKLGKLVPFDDSSLALVVSNTNIKHSHSGGEYASRVKECKEASQALNVAFLRDVENIGLVEKIEDETVRKRARHVVLENDRTLKAAEFAGKRQWAAFGLLMNESHLSLKNDFEVSCDELDFLVSIAQKQDGVLGARMTGGGFGGCVVSLVHQEHAEELVQIVDREYAEKFKPLKCSSYIFRNPENGACVLN